MNRYRAEILGRVPNGLTHNDVHATILSLMTEYTGDNVETCVKRRLAGGMVSVVMTFRAESLEHAQAHLALASVGVYNFSADIIGPKEVKS